MTTRSDTYPGTIDQPGTSWRWRVSVAVELRRIASEGES